MKLDILYRGPLASCNYRCAYCPFHKQRDDAAALIRDEAALSRVLDWVGARSPTDQIGILFIPWGEALVRRWYRDAIIALSRLPQVRRVAAQTNLSFSLDWLALGDRERIAFWATWHPDQVGMDEFLGRCQRLDGLGVSYSVGVVGRPAWIPAIAELRCRLPQHVYLWVNAYRDGPERYTGSDVCELIRIDPLFLVNLYRHNSRGRSCSSGHYVVTVDGDGVVRRCPFVAEPIGRLEDLTGDDERDAGVLRPRPCPNDGCDCHIGVVHLAHLGLERVFGDGVLERVLDPSRLAARLSDGSIGRYSQSVSGASLQRKV